MADKTVFFKPVLFCWENKKNKTDNFKNSSMKVSKNNAVFFEKKSGRKIKIIKEIRAVPKPPAKKLSQSFKIFF
jgi:hypothetical protein